MLAVVSGGLIGYPIGQSVADTDPNWTLAYIGAGVGIVGLAFTITSSKRIKKGIKIYNNSSDTSSTTFEPTIEFVANTNGIGLSLRF